MATARIPKRGPTNSVTRFLTRISNFDLLSIFDPKRPRPVPRSVLVNVSLPSHATVTAPKIPIWGISKHKEVEGPDGTVEKKKVQLGYGQKEVPGEGWIFESNQVLTSKYNVITFLPRNLLEQFRRVANIFFLSECKPSAFVSSVVCGLVSWMMGTGTGAGLVDGAGRSLGVGAYRVLLAVMDGHTAFLCLHALGRSFRWRRRHLASLLEANTD